MLPPAFSQWARAFGLVWAAVILWVSAVRRASAWMGLQAKERLTSPARRHFLRVAAGAAYAAPAAIGYAAILQRHDLQMREVEVRIAGLPKDLDGLKLVQLSDIHMGEFLSRSDVTRAVDIANETNAHIALITGDLISYDGDPLEECLAELKRLRADAGVFGCLGNHETYAHAEEKVTVWGARLGMRFLRGESASLSFGKANLNLAGVDYQPFRQPYLDGVESLVVPASLNVLLSHNPDVFPVARRKGFPLTI
ncbi:MAG: metallophosphoesterase, partial [Bryobacteraceae bacterium]